MPTYKHMNWFNLMDVLDEASRFGESVQYLKIGNEIHQVEVTNDPEKEFSVVINDVAIGEDFDFSEAYGIIKSCLAEEEPEEEGTV